MRETLCKNLHDSLALEDVSLNVVNSRTIAVADLVNDMTQINDNAQAYCTAVLVRTVANFSDLARQGSTAGLISTALSNILERAGSTGSAKGS